MVICAHQPELSPVVCFEGQKMAKLHGFISGFIRWLNENEMSVEEEAGDAQNFECVFVDDSGIRWQGVFKRLG